MEFISMIDEEEYIAYIQKNVNHRKFYWSETRWNFYIDVQFTRLQPQDYMLSEIELEGDGYRVDQGVVHVFIKYYVPGCTPLFTRRKHCQSLRRALEYIHHFPILFQLCHECGNLYKTKCEPCAFYRANQLLFSSTAVSCGICQEPTYRTKLSCGHFFHRTCLFKLDRNELRCPLCRSPISQECAHVVLKDQSEDEEYDSSDNECSPLPRLSLSVFPPSVRFDGGGSSVVLRQEERRCQT